VFLAPTRALVAEIERDLLDKKNVSSKDQPCKRFDVFKLSGGQRQRIAIARAFLKDAPILLLDEATAALDSESEEAIREALGRLMRGRTVIAIAHRLATLRNFDRVVMLKAGKIIEDGSPDRLMQGRGPYRELVTQEMRRLATHAA
jgi:ATP-binding cassette subfamily B protein